MNWLDPWTPYEDESASIAATTELVAELGPQHRLFGVSIKAIGHRQDCDDVLFHILDGTDRYAVVHLTFAQHPEPDPRWPETEMFENWKHFSDQRMSADHEDCAE